MSRPFHNRKRRGGDIGNRVIRRYEHPGKFEGEDATSLYAYSIVQNGMCDEEESFGDGGWYGRIDGPFNPSELRKHHDDEFGFLNRAERRFIAKQGACIVNEDSQGFFTCTWYDDLDEFLKAWKRVTDFFDRYHASDDDIK